jgi:Domain of unknown function (DUF4167)
MRNGQNKRMRGRNRKGGHHHHQNPLSRMYESNGPDVKIRGTASHVAEKYLQLARDAQSSGDPVAAENYYQHAEHYFRVIAAAQEQLRQSQPYYQPQQQPGEIRGADESYDDGDNEQPAMGGEPFAPREPQPYYPREQHHNPQQQHHHQQSHPQQFQPRHQNSGSENDGGVERLPSFITGNQPQQPQHGQPQHNYGGNGPQGQNGPNGYDGTADRFPLHRRRRRHRGGGGPREQAMDRSMDRSTDRSIDHSAERDDEGPPSGSHSVDE